jgi:hypothetical protein
MMKPQKEVAMDRDLGMMLREIAQISAHEDCRIAREAQVACNEASTNTAVIQATSTSANWRSPRQTFKAAA